MIFDWYKIINQAEWVAEDLVSRELEMLFEGIGLVELTVTQGRHTSLIYDGVMLPVGITSDNPFVMDGYAAYLDANGDIWLGILNEG
jgi:hypothetical protein